MPDFLLEIGCEEIPARMIDAASQELRERVSALLARERLTAGEIAYFDTPRRLAVMVAGISAAQADVTEQVTGPSVNVAYKNGEPTPAAHAFARKAGVDVAQLEKITTAKGEYLAAKSVRKAGVQPRFLQRICRRKSPRSTGRRVCTGARLTSGLCVRYGGWWRCSTGRRFRWS